MERTELGLSVGTRTDYPDMVQRIWLVKEEKTWPVKEEKTL